MTIYIDISILEKNRANTGIQRVLKEFVQRVVFNDNDSYTFKILAYNWDSKNMELLGIQEVKSFLKETASFQFEKNNPIDLKTIKVNETTIFLDMDSPWYAPISRDQLYPTLKENGFLIFNFIYDLVPIILPEYAHPNTVKIFKPFLDAVYRYSDTVLFDSLSANNDFIDYKNSLNITRDIPSRVVGLGSDFFKSTLKINDNYINNILEKKYILFVGTIEPRKNQENVLDAFEILSEKYPDLNLVFIGKNGWKVENLIHKIKNHPLKEKQLFWLNNIDDDTLSYFYQNAFIVTYLSKYEGYGLPIAESLGYGNITIASKNSSMYEVAHDTADYISYNTQNELIDIISLYCDNINLYNLKKEYIKDNFKITTWDTFSNSIFTIFDNFEQSIYLTQNHLKKLQFVFISIEIDSIKGTVEACDKYVDFIKEYIVITAPKFISKFENITTKNKITIIDETTILKEYKDGFSKRDHVSKNWILRTSLLNIENLDDEFIMLDDDNRPLKKITIDKYITKEGRYNGYYFHNLLEWNHKGTEYDIGQQNMKKIIANENYELLSYSSHAPQIINKKIFKEATDKFFKIGLTTPIDEWSIYFNYAVSRYPYAFNKKVFETLNWPANPYQWDYPYSQTEISFENYYKEIYDNGVFKSTSSFDEKLAIKEKETKAFQKSIEMFNQTKDILSSSNMVHGVCSFKNENIELYLSSIPYFVIVEQNSDIRLKLNYKLINLKENNLDISLVVFLDGKYRTLRRLNHLENTNYQESIIEIPIVSARLSDGIYDISFHILVNNKYIYPKNSPYNTKLVVSKDKEVSDIVKNPQVLNVQDSKKEKTIKEKIKSIPVVGWFVRWSYNLLRLNNLKHTVYKQQQQFKEQQEQLKQQQKQIQEQQNLIKLEQQHIQTLLRHNHKHHKNYEKLSETIYSEVSKHITNQSLLFSNRIDNYFSTQEKESIDLKPSDSIVLDDFYLTFEDTFRGSRKLILNRYKPYLNYINLDIKKALDIGCGRGEWTQLLQENNIDAYGIDLNFAMLNVGTQEGVKNLKDIDAFEYLASCEDNSFDLITAFHIIEHIAYEKLLVLMQEIKRVATPNATILLETPNPQNPTVASYEFYKDPTHLNPLPAPVIKFMVEYIGFKNVDIKYLNSLDNQPNPIASKAQDYLIVATR